MYMKLYLLYALEVFDEMPEKLGFLNAKFLECSRNGYCRVPFMGGCSNRWVKVQTKFRDTNLFVVGLGSFHFMVHSCLLHFVLPTIFFFCLQMVVTFTVTDLDYRFFFFFLINKRETPKYTGSIQG